MTNTVVGNVADTRAFNGFGEIVDYAVTASASSLYSATYTRDALGRVASQTETVGAATTEKVYDYDIRGRLTSVETDGVVTEWYAYDRNGNRTNSMNGAAIYDAQDRLLANASTTFAYNLNGSLTNRLPTAYSLQSTAFSYDLFGQLKSVTLPDGRVVSYDRDALSRITAKRIDGVIVKGWIYKDALKPIAETDASGNVVSFFVYGTSALSPDTMDKDGVTYRFIRDVQGSVRLVVDAATGVAAQRMDYDSFGNVFLEAEAAPHGKDHGENGHDGHHRVERELCGIAPVVVHEKAVKHHVEPLGEIHQGILAEPDAALGPDGALEKQEKLFDREIVFRHRRRREMMTVNCRRIARGHPSTCKYRCFSAERQVNGR